MIISQFHCFSSFQEIQRDWKSVLPIAKENVRKTFLFCFIMSYFKRASHLIDMFVYS